MLRYKPLIRSTLPLEEEDVGQETGIWRRAVGSEREVKHMSGITGLDLHPLTSDLLVTSNRIMTYDVHMDEKKSFYNNSPMAKYGARFRPTDGRLIGVGSQSGRVFIYDSISSKPLRELSDPQSKDRHTSAVRSIAWLKDNQILSCSDDRGIKVWDLADGSMVREFTDSSGKLLLSCLSGGC